MWSEAEDADGGQMSQAFEPDAQADARADPGGSARSDSGPGLRARAERLLELKENRVAADFSVEDILALTHEFQVHQIELELQNEELRRAQLDRGARFAVLENVVNRVNRLVLQLEEAPGCAGDNFPFSL